MYIDSAALEAGIAGLERDADGGGDGGVVYDHGSIVGAEEQGEECLDCGNA